ncbi:hypothetical protein IE53DRAFT_390375 [Violaceomyces palustris]|uniref:Uncharacterized protein n=1 Tax=Violaceomyces palustris TaxID=1673888 RepID=A0ACD0NNV2_9BASI|nr:hypothetical protein IE53DRAFT_390375 [Violaceomyces palustris]
MSSQDESENINPFLAPEDLPQNPPSNAEDPSSSLPSGATSRPASNPTSIPQSPSLNPEHSTPPAITAASNLNADAFSAQIVQEQDLAIHDNPFQALPDSSSPPSSSSSNSNRSFHQQATSEEPNRLSNGANFNLPSARPTFEPSTITVVDAQKTTDGASTFIAYVIRSGSSEAKRRYSEFESLRDALVKLHPTLIIPPIPSKHTIGDYAVKQSKAKEDATIIARRKRMLQSFLRRTENHPGLRDDEVFRKFLDGRYPWVEILHSPPLSHLPKSNLKAPAQNPADPHASPAYAALPLPSSASSLRNPNQRFIDSEAFTNRFSNHLSGSMEKVNRRLVKRWTETSADFAELGAILNGFSLTETGGLASAIERTGQAADSCFIATGQMLQDWEQVFTEPLHEYTQFASILQKLLKWRHLKHLQFELAQDALEAKKLQLEELERVEAEARRLDQALERGGGGLLNRDGSGRVEGRGIDATDASGIRDSVGRKSLYGSAAEDADGNQSTTAGKDAALVGSGSGSANSVGDSVGASSVGSGGRVVSSPTVRPSHKSSSSGYGLLGALSHTFHSVMDVDRDATRRNQIGKLREGIEALEEALSLTSNDLHFATTAIQADLDRFQRQKVADFKKMTLDFVRLHKEFCRINLENWKEAKREIEAIERPKGMPESNLFRKPS